MSPAVGSLSSIRFVHIPRSFVHDTIRFFRDRGASRFEGIVLWLGEISGSHAVIREVFIPRQEAIRSEDGVGYFVDGDALFDLNRSLSERKLRLIAQVHSHPGEAYHSSTDDQYAIVTTEGGFSAVVPDFGYGRVDLARWAFYRLKDGSWMELAQDVVARQFIVD